MKTSYSEKPARLELMPDGYHLYRWQIQEVADDNGTQWLCREVIIHGAVDHKKVTEAVIADIWGTSVENKLINDYNEFVITGENEAAKVSYGSFLAERRVLKLEIKEICNEQNTEMV